MTEIHVICEGPIVNRSDAKASGETQYFTGKPCVHGHIDLRWTCSARCKTCQRISTDRHRDENINRYDAMDIERRKMRWAEDKDNLKLKNKEWRDRNRDYNKERMKKFRKENPEYFRDYMKEYMKRPIWKMINHMSNSMKRVLRGASDDYGNRKLGYTSKQLRYHIECQFKPGMSWDNYGEWEIDHKIPMKWYFENGVNDPKVVNALENLQPLWKSENRSKGGRYEPGE